MSLEHAAPAVTWLIAPQTIAGLAQLLQLNLDTALPDGRTALLRFWDPRVLISLAELLEPGQREFFLATSTNGICCIRASGHGLEGSMLKLSEAQWEELQARDARQFATAVCDQFLAKRPDMLALPGRAAVQDRMHAAHNYALRIGFTSTPHIVRLMYLAADAPGIHDDPLIDACLRKPGAMPEQRLDDMLAVLNKKLERTH